VHLVSEATRARIAALRYVITVRSRHWKHWLDKPSEDGIEFVKTQAARAWEAAVEIERLESAP
jgi:hypothetical protein